MSNLNLPADNSIKTVRLILGDQLNANHSWYKQKDPSVLYVIAELKQETDYVMHHIQKVCAFFAAMENFASALSKAGHKVLHLTIDQTCEYPSLNGLVVSLVNHYQAQQFEYQLPDEYRLRQQLEQLSKQLACDSRQFQTEHFFLADDELRKYFSAGKHHRMEAFYRKMRKRFCILMDGEKPLGDKWNFDADNRNKLKAQDLAAIPQPLIFANSVVNILARLKRHKVKTFGQTDKELLWPVNRQQALQLLDYFCQHCLPKFGYFQDAMTCRADNLLNKKQWSLYHSRLSFALNSKMLSPQLVVNKALAAYNNSNIQLAQVEGFIRQILGWREFVRGIYWANMPHYQSMNYLEANNQLPEWFWHGQTKMNCMRHAIEQSLEYAYAHHIQRLMVTGNFCLIAGINPDQVDAWYLGIYIDAIEWVELPNTRGMSQFAGGGIVGSKAYAASGNYINKMTDYCNSCHYQVKQSVGDNACPLNALYWHFMLKHQQSFSANPRNKMVYANWQKNTEDKQQQILARAESLLANLNQL
ncbi:cryptochrome/photolyase family protein (plasmid) [Catenovulum sp. SX2]|uniref:cryptochrome/photolyase family protein n=1 Tax=Catenovulum sp. SX2 TaxID=3398614 RepID=UPI003F83D264